jgi:two-component system phosphate regulon sensor histidine kinase PhoR
MLILLDSSELELVIGSKFVHSFSHALKTPAHGILLLADSFRRRRAQRKFDFYFSMMELQIREFSGLIDNVLQFSELEMKEVEIKKEPINLAALLRSIAKVASKRAEEKDLLFEEQIPEKLPVHADAGMMRIVFNNLIDNALKYTEKGRIGIRALDSISQVEVSVYDTGIGIPEEDRDRIFDNFFRSSAPNVKAREGLGIGLHVSRRYVELHGGTLELACSSIPQESETGISKPGGSKFTVTLPKGS